MIASNSSPPSLSCRVFLFMVVLGIVFFAEAAPSLASPGTAPQVDLPPWGAVFAPDAHQGFSLPKLLIP